MKVILTEKPSVAKDLALHLGLTQRKNGYWLGKGYAITWAYGHLVTLALPESYGINGFQRDNLPIIPKDFLLMPRQLKVRGGYKIDARAFEQLQIIKELFERCESIIVATDAGREGELIFRYIYQYLQCQKPFQRLWISSLTYEAITKGFKNLQNGTNFDTLYQSAKARSQADWLIGINATQALSVQANNGIYSLGRVQTPTLAMVCKRYLENKNFASETYWNIQLQHSVLGTTFYTQSETSFFNKETAEKLIESIAFVKTVTVLEVVEKEKKEQPPLLYDLTALQKEAHVQYNFSASKTLEIAQSLYEKKLISYPRTGSRYISEDMWQKIPELIQFLERNETLKEHAKFLRLQKLQKRIVNDEKVTDHHALLITDYMPASISNEEKTLYQLIASRLLESVSAPCVKELTQIRCIAKDERFTTNGTVIVSEGWRAIRGYFEQTTTQQLPDVSDKKELTIKAIKLVEKQTQPKPLLTEATLLFAMENAGKTIENKEERLVIKEVGLGTPATRANSIETLFKRDYIKRQKKALLPTEKGLQVYQIVKDKRIADVAMTGMWERSLAGIEKGEISEASFQKAIEIHTQQITRELLQSEVKSLPKKQQLCCPKCKKSSVKIYPKVAKCTAEDCDWLVFRTICGKTMTEKAISTLLEKGKSPLLKGLQSKGNKIFDAYLVLHKDGTTCFKFPVKRKK
ncbi:type IA DNA topoisomerase [Aquimarina longa]|uniref:type IA DNA topoisomerase n=1 Tax=Aquimarina longa TaxID=1080221 RepID=UPI0007839DBE|nr:type IA DNA topoisomerase [Aquimarina longa]